jgi:hypothetical protein
MFFTVKQYDRIAIVEIEIEGTIMWTVLVHRNNNVPSLRAAVEEILNPEVKEGYTRKYPVFNNREKALNWAKKTNKYFPAKENVDNYKVGVFEVNALLVLPGIAGNYKIKNVTPLFL